jgi:hypothetical protein
MKQAIKGAVKSKTMWFNTLTGMLLAAEPALHLLQPVLGASTYGIVSFVLIVGNVALRTITNKALGEK